MLLQVFPFLNVNDARSILLASSRQLALTHAERRVAFASSFVSHIYRQHGPGHLLRMVGVPITWRPIVSDVMVDYLPQVQRSDLALAISARCGDIDAMHRLLASGRANFSAISKEFLIQNSPGLFPNGALAREFRVILRRSPISDFRTHLQLTRFIVKHFDWAQTIFYSGSVVKHREALLRFVLEHGADLRHQTNSHAASPLLMNIAAGTQDDSYGHRIDEVLLDHGDDPNLLCTFNQMTALHMASARAHVPIVSRLLAAGANPNASGPTSLTPMHHAANNENSAALQVVKLLHQFGGSVQGLDADAMTPLHFAVTKGHLAMVRLLCDLGAEIACEPIPPLFFAAGRGHLEIVHELVHERGADPNQSSKYGKVPLHSALEWNHLHVCRYLIENGADVDLPDDSGADPMAYAISNNFVQAVELLIDHGADLNVHSIHLASRLGYAPILHLCIAAGAEVDRRDPTGKTALMYAVRFGKLNCIELLLEAGSAINAMDLQNLSALDYVQDDDDDANVAFALVQAGAMTGRDLAERKLHSSQRSLSQKLIKGCWPSSAVHSSMAATVPDSPPAA